MHSRDDDIIHKNLFNPRKFKSPGYYGAVLFTIYDRVHNRSPVNYTPDELKWTHNDLNKLYELLTTEFPRIRYEDEFAHITRGSLFVQLRKSYDTRNKEGDESFQDYVTRIKVMINAARNRIIINCMVCGNAAQYRCQQCNNSFYCNEKCQAIDWKQKHQFDCK